MSARARTGLVAVVLLAVLLMSQLGAAASAPAQPPAATGKVMGRAAFAYLGGLRTFTAAVLWNRLEPQFHAYYESGSIEDLDYMIPTLAIVQKLDPQFIQAYYLSSYIVAKKEGYPTGIELAREGVRNNPRSGLMRANVAQLLLLDDFERHQEELLEHAKVALSDQSQWKDADEVYEGYVVFRDVMRKSGKTKVAEALDDQLKVLREDGAGEGDHDHDGDGKQDH